MDEKKKLEPPSGEFERAVAHSGSTVINCELCGRVHFAANGDGYEEGELDKLLEKARKTPKTYVADSQYDSISWGNIDGKQAVIGCACNILRKYEDWIWSYRHIIISYLKARAKRGTEDAKREEELVAGLEE